MSSPEDAYDIVGVGVGPSNLSLAALADPLKQVSARFLERSDSFSWHPGMLLPGASLQVSYLKDLVTTVDPTSRFSFLSFLKDRGRLYRFLVAQFPRVSRLEFEQYYRWTAEQLDSIQFGTPVIDVSFRQGLFEVRHPRGTVRGRNLVIGSGQAPKIPAWARKSRLGGRVVHSSEFLLEKVDTAQKRVAVIGGGQSGAEVVLHLLTSREHMPRRLSWITARRGFLPLDDSPFTNELFFPDNVDHFFGLPPARRQSLVQEQVLASDGASEATLRAIYQRLYEVDHLGVPGPECTLAPSHYVRDLRAAGDEIDVVCDDEEAGARRDFPADVVVLCTGYAYQVPGFLDSLAERISWTDGWFEVRRDYSVEWDGPLDRGIYIQNGARHSHGIADPNLSLSAWRSASILNSVCGWLVYDIDQFHGAMCRPPRHDSASIEIPGVPDESSVINLLSSKEGRVV